MSKTARNDWTKNGCLWGSVTLTITLFCLLAWASAQPQYPVTNTPTTTAASEKQPFTAKATITREENHAPQAKATTDTSSAKQEASAANTTADEQEVSAAGTTANEQEHPAAYTWTCGKDYGGIAPADGSLSEWAPHYYVAHSFGPYGQAILGLEPGDTVTINGDEVTVQGAVVMSLGSAYENVMSAVGWDATVFQTCVPNTNDCRFVYARGASSTESAARAAKQWAGLDSAKGSAQRQHAQEPFSHDVLSVPSEPVPEPAETEPAETEPADMPAEGSGEAFHDEPPMEPLPENDFSGPEGPM